MHPLKDLLLIEPLEKQNKTEAGILIKEAWETAQNKALVRDIGPEVTTVKRGQLIIFNPYAAMNVDKQKIISEKDVIAIWDE